FAVADAGHLVGTEAALAEEVGDDLRVASAERGGEVGAVEVAAQFAAGGLPGDEVQLGSVNQRSIDVPDGGPRHRLCSSRGRDRLASSGYRMSSDVPRTCREKRFRTARLTPSLSILRATGQSSL